MRISGPSQLARWPALLALLMVSACSKAVQQDKPSASSFRPDAMVAGLYKQVLARPSIFGMGDPKVIGPYLSKELRHRFDDNAACFDDWNRQHPGSTDKPPFSLLEMGAYSGVNERSSPNTFHIERTEAGKDGSSRVYVKFTWGADFKALWHVAAVVVREHGRPVVDDVIYLKDKENPEEYRLSDILLEPEECNGPRWSG